jgi:methyl halide transferase
MYTKPSELDAVYWSKRFKNKDTPWDIGSASPPLKAYIDQLANKNASILIPGCGNSHEADYLLQNGFTNITLIDISSVVSELLAQKFAIYLQKELTLLTGNFFDLTTQYDIILEQTFFCALTPVLRKSYAEKMASLLKEGGKLAGVLFNRSFDGGPPFGGSRDEYEALFKTNFTIRLMEPCYNSIQPRMGVELFFIAEKKH